MRGNRVKTKASKKKGKEKKRVSTLQEIVKEKKMEASKKKPIHAVIRREVAEKFKAFCKRNGIEMSKTIEDLLEREMSAIEKGT